MKIRNLVQNKLDNLLLKDGIMSHHIRRVEVDVITDSEGKQIDTNNDEYVVYRVLPSKKRIYADGKPIATQYFIDVSYYYHYNKNNSQVDVAEKRIKSIIDEFLTDPHFKLANDQNDLPDLDNPYRGVNIELSYIGV